MIRSSMALETENAALTAAREHFLLESYTVLLNRIRTAAAAPSSHALNVGFSCSLAGEGVSTVVANLATAAAMQHDGNVLVVDAHFARPRASQLLKARGEIGLGDLISGAVDLEDCLRPSTQVSSLHVIPAGSPSARQHVKLTAASVRALLKMLRDRFSLVLWDLPPVCDGSAALAAAGALHGMILVAEAERVRSPEIEHAKSQLLGANAKILGVVFNKRREHVPDWLYQRL